MNGWDGSGRRERGWLPLRRRGRFRGSLPGVGRCRLAGAVWLVVGVVLLGGCSGSDQRGDGAVTQPQQGLDEMGAVVKDPRELSYVELHNGAGVLELGVSKLLEEVGVMELLSSYIINVPWSAEFISGFETSKGSVASLFINADGGAEGDVVRRFESEVLYHVSGAVSSLSRAVVRRCCTTRSMGRWRSAGAGRGGLMWSCS